MRSLQMATVLCFVLLSRAVAACDGDQIVRGVLDVSEWPTLRIADDARRYRLAHIGLAPMVAVDLSEFAGEKAELCATGTEVDRYDRLPAEVRVDGVSIQRILLQRGVAFVLSLDNDGVLPGDFRDAEHSAVNQRRGVWSDGGIFHQASDLNDLDAAVGGFVVVEGEVLSIGDRKRRLYLNFGKDWSTDFTAVADKSGSNQYRGNIDALKMSKGRRIRVRGILEWRGGPMIRLTHDWQVERF